MRFKALPRVRCRRNRDGSKTWWAEWFETVAAGKRRHRSIVLGDCRKVTKAEAKDRLEEALDAESPTSATWTVERFVREVWFPPRLRRWPHNTRKNTEAMVQKHILPVFGHMRLCDVRKMDVEAWTLTLAGKAYSRATGRMLLTHLRSILEEACANDLLGRNPAIHIRLPEMAPAVETRPYSGAEVVLLASEPGVEGLVLRLMLLCGLRPGEALAIEPGAVTGRLLMVDKSLDYPGHVKSTKTGKVRVVSLPPLLAADLRGLLEATPAGERVFARWRSVGRLRESLLYRFRGVIPGFNLRRCRTTFATELRADVADIRDLLGHTHAVMTLERYRRGVTARQAEAVAELERRAMESGRVQ